MISQLIYTALHAWINAIKYVSLNNISFERLIFLVRQLSEIRQNLLDPLVTYNVNNACIVKLINEGNTFFGMEFIPFANNLFVDPSNTNLYDIFEIHSDQMTSRTSISDINAPDKQQIVDDYYHLYISFESVLWELGDPSMWCIGIYDSVNDSYITLSEKFIIHYKSASIAKEHQAMSGCALFELAKSSIFHGLFLFIKVYRFSIPIFCLILGSLFSEKKNECDSSYKRPYAIAGHYFF
ncbi:hypothetical protein MXB_1307 [Myxobolus squamalis]|nr:hypothetical protein MXB_1307 [Myxobolus squamalis]